MYTTDKVLKEKKNKNNFIITKKASLIITLYYHSLI